MLPLSALIRPFPKSFLVAASRSPQDPSCSLPIPLDETRKDTIGKSSRGLSRDRYSRSIGRLLQNPANGADSPLATITFLGAQQDITDPEVEVLVAGRRRNADIVSTEDSWLPLLLATVHCHGTGRAGYSAASRMFLGRSFRG